MQRLFRALLRVLGFSKLLVLVNAALVALAVYVVAGGAVSRFDRLANEQATGRAELAGANALDDVARSADDALANARLLSERPTLRRMLETGNTLELGPFLDRFRETAGLSGIGVMRDDAVFATSGAPFPWSELLVNQGTHLGRYLVEAQTGGGLTLGASAAVPGVAGGIILVARKLEVRPPSTETQVSSPSVSLVARSEVLRQPTNPQFSLRRQAIEWEEKQSAFVPEVDAIVAAFPLRAPAGNIVGVIESRVPNAEVLASTRRFRDSIGFVAVLTALFAAVASAILARRLVGPVERLRLASERIGRGDFATPIPRPAGREVGALAATMEDMRARLLRLTGELRRRGAEADAILGGIAEGVYSVDSERRVRYMNPQAAALLGVDLARSVGKFCGDVLRPETDGGVRPCEEKCPIIHARFRGQAIATEHLLGGDGVRRTLVITSGGPATAVAGSGESSPDVPHQFQVIRGETGVESSRRMRDAVLANISHEFRTPLAAQLASIELLRDRLPELELDEVSRLLLSIERGTIRLTQLIDNLLESVRIEAGQDSIRRQPVALDEVVEEATDLAAPLFALREQRVEADLPYPLPSVSGDRARLVQVFVNLLGNANKFAPAGSTIRVGGEILAGRVTLWVEDEGPGVPEAERAAIFERFTRSTGEEPAESGMGLGLWIVRSIVERHGGAVAVRSASSGSGGATTTASAGTRLCITLPLDGGR